MAYCFDRAVATFGMSVEQDLDAASEDASNAAAAKSARLRALNRWLSAGDEVPAGTFRDPFAQ